MPSDDLFADSEEERSRNEKPDASVRPELFRKWRSPRVGTTNPEPMDNPVWAWLVRSRLNAYQANKRMRGPSSFDAGPCWCFDRFGQSATTLPDGRRVFIAGEHEDHYDPDFYIYNDVVVIHPNGRIQIFGYPHSAFPPTDFHSATLMGETIVIIGNLGYPDHRQPGTTPVFLLDLDTFAISPVSTYGTGPGWIREHTAELSTDQDVIRIRGGTVEQAGKAPARENVDEWELSTRTWEWQRVTDRKWPQFEVAREDGEMNQLFQLRMALFERDFNVGRDFEAKVKELRKELGVDPDFALLDKLYRPPVTHQEIEPAEDEHNVHRINVGGVIVRYTEDFDSVRVMVEGSLAEETVKAIGADLRDKLARLENTGYEIRPL